jgi:hypothetical protein
MENPFDMTEEQKRLHILDIMSSNFNVQRKAIPFNRQDITDQYRHLFTIEAYDFIKDPDNTFDKASLYQFLELLDGKTFKQPVFTDERNPYSFKCEDKEVGELAKSSIKRVTPAMYTSVLAIGRDNIQEAAQLLVDNFNDLVAKGDVLKVMTPLFVNEIDTDRFISRYVVGLFFFSKPGSEPREEYRKLYAYEGSISEVVVE